MRQDKYKLIQDHSTDNYLENSRSNTKIDYLDEYLDFPSNNIKTSITPTTLDSQLESFPLTQGYAHINDAPDETGSENWTEIVLTQSPISDDIQLNKTSPDDVNDDDDDELEDDDNDGDVNDNADSDNMNNSKKKNESNVTNWIGKSNLKSKDRRQSLDILYDASDKVKDVFAQGFQKVGRTLERRNSESEVSLDFFFNR